VGEIDVVGVPELDATGLYVSPGFVDIHSHSDNTLLVDPRAVSAIYQGVTLEVVGNCGYGCFPIKDASIGKTAVYGFTESEKFAWASANDYFDGMEEAAPAVNVLSLVPNGQLRLATVGFHLRPADSVELRQMKGLLEQALEEGAWGYSTGLEYAWESGATEDEIVALCEVAGRADGIYATHTRRRDDGAVEAVEEATRTAERAGARLQVSHLVPRNGHAGLVGCVESVEAARDRGVDVAFDMHTRLHGLTYLHAALPPEALSGGPVKLIETLSSASARAEIVTYQSLLNGGGASWDQIVLYDNKAWPEYARRDIASIARERGQIPMEAVCDLLLGVAEDTRQLMVIINSYDETQQKEIFVHPLCMPGSDATTLAPDGPLAESFFHGAYTWASWFFRFMVRDNQLLSPEGAIHRLSGLPAERMGITGRGVLEPSAAADVVVFDPDVFAEVGSTYDPNRTAKGMVHVVVNGFVTMKSGQLTGVRGGRVLRKQ
jgi:N-acyl-D-amino-acid deacylase